MAERHVSISPREHQLVKLIAAGQTEDQCAEEMDISPRTVKGIADTLRWKLGVKTRREIPLAYWRETGLDPYPGEEVTA